MNKYTDKSKPSFDGDKTRFAVETRSASESLDRDSVANERGCGPEPIGLRSDFEME